MKEKKKSGSVDRRWGGPEFRGKCKYLRKMLGLYDPFEIEDKVRQ